MLALPSPALPSPGSHRRAAPLPPPPALPLAFPPCPHPPPQPPADVAVAAAAAQCAQGGSQEETGDPSGWAPLKSVSFSLSLSLFSLAAAASFHPTHPRVPFPDSPFLCGSLRAAAGRCGAQPARLPPPPLLPHPRFLGGGSWRAERGCRGIGASAPARGRREAPGAAGAVAPGKESSAGGGGSGTRAQTKPARRRPLRVPGPGETWRGGGKAAWKGPWQRRRKRPGACVPVSSPGAAPPPSCAPAAGPRRSRPQQASAGLPLFHGVGGFGIGVLGVFLPLLALKRGHTGQEPLHWRPGPGPSPTSPTPPPMGLPKSTSRVRGGLGGISESGSLSGLKGLFCLTQAYGEF